MPVAQQLGRYQLLDRIAFGGMAEIYRAKTFDAEGAHLVAVKRVLGHLTADEDFVKMLVDEARINALLEHDNIARIYEFAHADEEYFIAMEYVDGKDVRALLERCRQLKRPVPPEHVLWVAMEAAKGLHAAHIQRDAAGELLHLVHRDVSPSNILLAYGGEVKLCDFGIAKATFTRVQTRTGVIKGKVKYMSPEQALGRRLDHRSDLFSLGTVMYEMLTLELPFQAATEVELIFAVRDARKRDAREVNPDIPPELNDIVNQLTVRQRNQRFANGRELAMALRDFLESYRPGYKRSHFGRFMRQLFEEEIEKGLRLLEDYVLSEADPMNVGENLIADVLGANAPYTKFTAVAGEARKPTPPRKERPSEPASANIHAEPTYILTRNRVPAEREQDRSLNDALPTSPPQAAEPPPSIAPPLPRIREEEVTRKRSQQQARAPAHTLLDDGATTVDPPAKAPLPSVPPAKTPLPSPLAKTPLPSPLAKTPLPSVSPAKAPLPSVSPAKTPLPSPLAKTPLPSVSPLAKAPLPSVSPAKTPLPSPLAPLPSRKVQPPPSRADREQELPREVTRFTQTQSGRIVDVMGAPPPARLPPPSPFDLSDEDEEEPTRPLPEEKK